MIADPDSASRPGAPASCALGSSRLPDPGSAPSPAPPVDPGAAARIVGSGFWALGGQLGYLAVAFFVTPVIIRFLGAENYGLLTLVYLFVGYLSFAEFGMGTASTKYGAEAYSRRDGVGESAAVWTSFAVQALPIALAIGLLVWTGDALASRILRVPGRLQHDAAVALKTAGPLLLFSSLSAIFNTSQLVRLRYDLSGMIGLGSNVAQAVVTLMIVINGGGIVAVVCGAAAVSAATAVANFVSSAILCRHLLRPRLQRSLLAPLMRYGSGIVLTVLLGAAIQHGEKFIVASILSVKMLAYYNVAFTVAGALSLFASAVSQPVLPVFVQLTSSSERGRLEALYGSARRGAVLAAIPLAFLVAVCARPFLIIWVGADFGSESITPLYILIAGALFHSATFVPRGLLLASGHVGVAPRLHIIELIPYGAAALFLVRTRGILGAAIASSLRMLFECVYFTGSAHRLTGIRSSLTAGAGTAFAWALLVLVLPMIPLLWIQPSSAALVAGSVLAVSTYSWIVLARILTREEFSWLMHRLPAPAGRALQILVRHKKA